MKDETEAEEAWGDGFCLGANVVMGVTLLLGCAVFRLYRKPRPKTLRIEALKPAP